MLVKLLPMQIADYWETIRFSVIQTFPEYGEPELTSLLESLLADLMDCWLIYSREEDTTKVDGIALTCVNHDASGQKSMVLYMVYVFTERDQTDVKLWVEGFKTITKYAKSKDCDSLTAYSNVDAIIEKAKLFSGVSTQTFIRFKL